MNLSNNSTNGKQCQVPIYWHDYKPSHNGYKSKLFYEIEKLENNLWKLADDMTDGDAPDYRRINNIQDGAQLLNEIKGEMK